MAIIIILLLLSIIIIIIIIIIATLFIYCANCSHQLMMSTFKSFFAYEVLFHVWRHVKLKRKREMSVDFFLHHRQHVERISHRVEA